MGFLDFLKRQKPRKGMEFEDLDLPPAPPPLEDFDSNPDTDDRSIPEIPTPEESGMGEDLNQETPELEADFGESPAEPKAQEHEEYMPIEELPSAEEAAAEPAPASSAPLNYGKGYRRHFPKMDYININNLKNVLLSAKMIKNELNMAQSENEYFDNIRMKQEKAYDRLSSISHELQKKLVYMDKNLFNKGEKA